MTNREKILLIIGGTSLVGAFIIILTLFGKRKDGIDYKELIKAKDETIQAVIRERDTYRQWKDNAIQELQTKDSLLQIRVKTNTVRYEKIPVIVGNLSDEELRSAVESFR